jgi:thioredoxin 1
LDVDNNQLAAEKFGIRSIPTILIFKGGQLVDTIIGAVGKPYITERLEAHVN